MLPSLPAALDALRRRQLELAARGVQRVAIFCSLARGNTGPDSDVDVFVVMAADSPRGLMALGGVAYEVEEAIGTRDFDLVDLDQMKPAIRAEAERDAVYAF